MSENRKSIQTGAAKYTEALEHYYVDKTLFIRDIIDRNAVVSAIIRPKGFGKSLNMDMLRTFFEKTDQDTALYFRDSKIWACGDEYRNEQGRYPVVFLSFSDAQADTWDETYVRIKSIISAEYRRHAELMDSCWLLPDDIEKYRMIADVTAEDVEYRFAVRFLTRILNKHWNGCKEYRDRKKPVVLVDDYDVPIQAGLDNGYYDQAVYFMTRLLSAGLTDNPHLYFGVMTGAFRMPSETARSDLDKIIVYTLSSRKYSSDFGFTQDDVHDLLAYYGAEDRYDEICKHCGKCTIGGAEIFCPGSVMDYVSACIQPCQRG